MYDPRTVPTWSSFSHAMDVLYRASKHSKNVPMAQLVQEGEYIPNEVPHALVLPLEVPGVQIKNSEREKREKRDKREKMRKQEKKSTVTASNKLSHVEVIPS